MVRFGSLIMVAAALVSTGAAVFRSPKDAANQPKVKVVAPVTNQASALLPPAPAANPNFVIVRPPKPYHITLAWEPDTSNTFALWYGSNSMILSRRLTTTNPWITASNLFHPATYFFAITCINPQGVESDFSPLLMWPRPVTNYFALGVAATTNAPWTTNSIFTNSPDCFYRLHAQAGQYALQASPNFQQWNTATNWPGPTLPSFYLRHQKWDNVTGFEHPD